MLSNANANKPEEAEKERTFGNKPQRVKVSTIAPTAYGRQLKKIRKNIWIYLSLSTLNNAHNSDKFQSFFFFAAVCQFKNRSVMYLFPYLVI